jgi:hypothetical protein
MPVIVPCPRCGQKVRVSEDLLGTRVRCPQCQTAFLVEPETEPSRPGGRRAAAAPPEDDETLPRPRRRRDAGSPVEWARVRTGITFTLASVFVFLLSLVALVVALVVTGGAIFNAVKTINADNQLSGKDAAPFIGAVVLFLSAALIFLASHALSLTGHIFCVFSPPSHGAKVLAIIALVLSSLSLLSCCGGGAIGGARAPRFHVNSSSSGQSPRGFDSGGSDGGGGGSPVGLEFFFDLAEKIVFLFFLRSVALSVRANGVATSIVYQLVATGLGSLLSCGLVCGGVLLGAGALFQALSSQDPGAALKNSAGGYAVAGVLMGALLVLIWIVLFVWYIVTLLQVRSALTRYLASRD